VAYQIGKSFLIKLIFVHKFLFPKNYCSSTIATAIAAVGRDITI
jgi:hypothetical protein